MDCHPGQDVCLPCAREKKSFVFATLLPVENSRRLDGQTLQDAAASPRAEGHLPGELEGEATAAVAEAGTRGSSSRDGGVRVAFDETQVHYTFFSHSCQGICAIP